MVRIFVVKKKLHITYRAIFLVKNQTDDLAHIFSLLQVIELIFIEMNISTSFSSDSIIEDLESLKEHKGIL